MGEMPSTSLPTSRISVTRDWGRCLGRGICTMMPLVRGSALSCCRVRVRVAASVCSSSACRAKRMPAEEKLFSICLTYQDDAGSPPTWTTAMPGTQPCSCWNPATWLAISPLMTLAIARPSRVCAAIDSPLRRPAQRSQSLCGHSMRHVAPRGNAKPRSFGVQPGERAPSSLLCLP